jgi:hypothetical protein
MQAKFLQSKASDNKLSNLRISKTKEAIKQLLKEIANGANAHDQAIVTQFDEKLHTLIPLCEAGKIAEEPNLSRIDNIKLSNRSIRTYLYAVLKEVYEKLEQQPSRYIDLYIFSDGRDTSRMKNTKQFQALIRYLNETLGVKCHYMYCGSFSTDLSVTDWLGDKEADCPLSGDISAIQAQVKAQYKTDHVRNPSLAAMTVRTQANISEDVHSSENTLMTNMEAAKLRKPIKNLSATNESLPVNSDTIDIDDYLSKCSLANNSRAYISTSLKSKPPEIPCMATRNLPIRKLTKN